MGLRCWWLPALCCFAGYVRANIGLVMPTTTVVGQNVTLQWTRAQGDPTHFFIQSILFSASLSQFPELFEVNVPDSQLKGTLPVESKFAGDHILVASDPTNGSHLYATSNAFSVDQSAGSSTTNSGNTSASTPTVSNPSSTPSPSTTTSSARPTDAQSSSSSSSSSCNTTTVGAVLGVLLGLSFILCAFLIFKLYRRRTIDEPTFLAAPPVTARSTDYVHQPSLAPLQPLRGGQTDRTADGHVEPFTAASASFSSSGVVFPEKQQREREIPLPSSPSSRPAPSETSASASSTSAIVLQRLNALEQAVLNNQTGTEPPPEYMTEHNP